METKIIVQTFDDNEYSIVKDNFDKDNFLWIINNSKFIEINDTLINIRNIKNISFRENRKALDRTKIYS